MPSFLNIKFKVYEYKLFLFENKMETIWCCVFHIPYVCEHGIVKYFLLYMFQKETKQMADCLLRNKMIDYK